MNIVNAGEKLHDNPTKRLAELHPEEIVFFKKKFVWASNRSGFYTRIGYDHDQPWMPRKTFGGGWLPLYPALVDDLVEKHIDFDRFCLTRPDRSPVRPQDSETGFWFGTMMGEYTYHDCLDIDSHDRVGWYGLPTRWHPDLNEGGSWADLYIYRYVPVMRIGLPFFVKVKKLYDSFPGRVWAFSSASLGLYAYRMYPKSMDPEKLYAARKQELKDIGMKVEVYPEPPKSEGSKGHHQRRPCGMDSGVITDQGIVSDPIEQIRVYMNPVTPSFEAICEAVIKRLTEQYSKWLAFNGWGRLDKKVDKVAIWSWQQEEISRVRSWVKDGCPDVEKPQGSLSCTLPSSWSISSDPLRSRTADVDMGPSSLSSTANNDTRLVEKQQQNEGFDSAIPEMFIRADLKVIDAAGQWVQWVECIARHGFLADDTFMEVITSLTKWLYFVELWDVAEDERRDRIKALLKTYCQIKGNGHISRLLNGDLAAVERNVDHLVDSQVATINNQGDQVFEDLRRKRASGRYVRVIMIESLLSTTLSSPSSIYSGPLRTAEAGPDSDDTPLPDSVQEYVISGFKKHNMPLRRNKDGYYPTLQAVTRLINHLSTTKSFEGRLGQQDFARMGFANSNREKIKKVLYRLDVIEEGDYRAKKQKKRYSLGETVLNMLGKATRCSCQQKAG